MICRNPARIDGAGNEDSPEREIIPLALVFDIMAKLPDRYRALVLMATFTQLRFGELAGLRRHRLDLNACTVQVTEASVQPGKGALLTEPPKFRAGLRTVSFPVEIVQDLRDHLALFAEPGSQGLVFVGPKGGTLRRKTTSTRSGRLLSLRSVSRTRTFTISDTQAARSPRPPGPLPRNSWPGSATPARARR